LAHDCLLQIENLFFIEDVVNEIFPRFVENSCLNDYIHPSVNEVDLIPLLDIFPGFSCSLCILSNPDLSVMTFHAMAFHPECNEAPILPAMVQKPFDAWIKVKSPNNSTSDSVLISKRNPLKNIYELMDGMNNDVIDDSFDMAIHAVLGEQLVSTLKSLNLAVVEKLGVFVCKTCNSLYVISDLKLVET
jgi:hypothetical protein